MGGVFISYRSEDSSSDAALIHTGLCAHFGDDQVFLDSESIASGDDFGDTLLARLRQSRVLIVVIGRRWLTVQDQAGWRRIDSAQDWVRRELREAFAHRLRVIPLLATGAEMPAESDLPADIAALHRRQSFRMHSRNTSHDLARLVQELVRLEPELKAAAQRHVGGVTSGRGVEQPPMLELMPHKSRFGVTVDRPEVAQVTGLLTVDPAPTVCITGHGGYGKTVLAYLAALRPEIQRRYPDGVLWIDLNEAAVGPTLTRLIDDYCTLLPGFTRQSHRDPDEAGRYLASALSNRRVLIVLDDVWHESQLRPFMYGAPQCARLLTSRLQNLLRDGPTVVLGVMTDTQSDELLRTGNSDIALDTAPLLRYSGGWPLLLSLMNGAISVRMRRGFGPMEAVEEVSSRLERLGPTALDRSNPQSRDGAVAATIDATIEFLQKAGSAADRLLVDVYLSLAIFPLDIEIPFDPVRRVVASWTDSGEGSEELIPPQLEQVCEQLADYSLIEYAPAEGVIRLHRIVGKYLARKRSADRRASNRRLLDTYRKNVPEDAGRAAWWNLPAADSYIWDNLTHHLEIDDPGARRSNWPTCTGQWLTARLGIFGPIALEADLAGIETELSRELRAAIRQYSHLLTSLTPANALLETLLAAIRPEQAEGVRAIMAAEDAHAPRLQLVHPPVFPSIAMASRVLSGHRGSVTAIVQGLSDDEIISGDDTGEVRTWNFASGSAKGVIDTFDRSPEVKSAEIDDPTAIDADLDDFRKSIREMRKSLHLTNIGEQSRFNFDAPGAISGLAATHAGGLLTVVTGSEYIRVFDLATAREVIRIRTDGSFDVYGERDQTWIVTSGLKGKITLLDLDTGARCSERRVSGGFGWADLAGANGRIVALGHGSGDGILTSWRVAPRRKFGRRWGAFKLIEESMILLERSAEGPWISSNGAFVGLRHGENFEIRAASSLDLVRQIAVPDDQEILAATVSNTGGRVMVGTDSGAILAGPDPGKKGDFSVVGGHSEAVRAMASYGDEWVVSGGDDRTVRLWRSSGIESRSTAAALRNVSAQQLDPRAEWLLCVGSDNVVEFREAASGEVIRTLDAPTARLVDVRIAANGEWMASGAGEELFVWNRAGSRMRKHNAGKFAEIRAILSLSDSGEVVALTSVGLISSAAGKTIPMDDHKNPLVAWCSGNSLIATANADRGIRVWEANSLQIFRMFPVAAVPSRMIMDADLGLIVGEESGRVSLLDVHGRVAVKSAQVTDSPVSCLASRGNWVLAGFQSGQIAALKVLEAGISVEWLRRAHDGVVHSADIAEGESCYATTGADSTVRTWSSGGGRLAALRLPGRMLLSTWTRGHDRLSVSGYTGSYALRHFVNATALRRGIERFDR